MKFLTGLFALMFGVMSDCAGYTNSLNIGGVSDVAAAIPTHWAKGIVEDGSRKGFWGALTGKEGSQMPVIQKTGPLGESGNTLVINTIAQLMGSGRTAEDVLRGYEEKLSVGSYCVSADMVRHAVALTRKSTFQANFDQVAQAKALLTDWMTRKMDADAFSALLAKTGENLYPSGITSEDSLTSSDRFSPTEIEAIRLALIRKGARPIQIRKQNGQEVPVYGIAFGEVEEYYLNNDSTFLTNVRESWERFVGKNEHPIFNNVIGMYRNCLLYRYYSTLDIPQGTPLRPETTVYATLTTTATASMTVGGAALTGPDSQDVTPNYTQFFGSTGKILIDSEAITYTGKTNNTFTGLTRGALSTTAAQHAPNAIVTQRNVSSVLGFGANALCRAIGENPTAVTQNDDYNAQIGLGIEAYYGQVVPLSKRTGRANNIVIHKVYSDNPGAV